jgi:hypothetical protein
MSADKELDEVFDDLQDRMEKEASIYKGTKFDPFYQFIIGKMGYQEAVDKIAETLNESIASERK